MDIRTGGIGANGIQVLPNVGAISRTASALPIHTAIFTLRLRKHTKLSRRVFSMTLKRALSHLNPVARIFQALSMRAEFQLRALCLIFRTDSLVDKIQVHGLAYMHKDFGKLFRRKVKQ